MFIFAPMTETDARAIGQWHYADPYAIYSMTDDAESIAEMLDPRSPHYAVREESGVVIGFFAYGTAAEVGQDNPPALFVEIPFSISASDYGPT